MPELAGWTFGELDSAYDVLIGGVRRTVQATEDGYYGFAVRRGKLVIKMLGPYLDIDTAVSKLRREIMRHGLQD